MSRYENLLKKIQNKQADSVMIGMRYIDLPTSLFYAIRGLMMRGVGKLI